MAKTVTSGAPAAPVAKGEAAKVSLEAVMKDAGINAGDARAKLQGLAGTFPDGIPEGALNRWADEYRGQSGAFWLALGRAWEKEKKSAKA